MAADFVRSRYSADPAWRASASQLLHSELPRIAREEEEALVKDLLLQLLIQGEPEAQFEVRRARAAPALPLTLPAQPYLDSTWLASQMAEAALLRGAPASETLSWLTRAHDPALAKRVTERPELLLVPENKRHFRWDEPVVLDVDVKNVPALIVKVFEVNTEAYYRKARQGAAVVPHAVCRMLRAACCVPHTACRILRAACSPLLPRDAWSHTPSCVCRCGSQSTRT